MNPNRKCSNCGREVYPGASKCAYCGYPYKGDYIDGKPVNSLERCPNCGRQLPPGANKCNDCGYHVGTNSLNKPASNMRKCPNCGKMVYDYLASCPNCGCNLRGIPRQSFNSTDFNNPNSLNPADIEQAMEGGMPNDTDAGTIEQINEILHDNGDDMW